MADPNSQIVVEVVLNLDDLKKGFKGAEDAAKKSGEKIGQSFGSELSDEVGNRLPTAFGRLSAAALAVGVPIAAAAGAFKGVLLGEEIKQVTAQFDFLAERAKIGSASLIDGLTAASRGLIDNTDLMKAASRSLIELNGNAEKLPKIMELARKATSLFGGDLLQNFEAMGHAIATGQTRQLKALGIIIDSDKAMKDFAKTLGVSANALNETGKQQAILNAVLEKGNAAFKGVPDQIKPATEALQRLKIAFGETIESAAAVTEKKLGSTTTKVLDFITKSLQGWGFFIKSLDKDSQEATVFLASNLTRELEILQSRAAAALQRREWGIARGIQAEISRVERQLQEVTTKLGSGAGARAGAAVGAAAAGFRSTLSGGGGSSAVQAAANKERFVKIEQMEKERLDRLAALDRERSDSLQARMAIAEDTQTLFMLQNQQIELMRTEHLNRVQALENQYRELGLLNSQEYNNRRAALEEAHAARIIAIQQKQAEGSRRLQQITQQAVVQGIGGSFSALGAALAKSENGFSAFGKALLGTIGDLAIQLGTFIVATAIGFSGLGIVLPGFLASAAVAIPAGLALITLGGALKAISGGGGSTAGGGVAVGGAGGEGGFGGAGAGTSTQLAQTETGKPSTGVTVNVQGNILDRRESGLEIARIIEESFSTQGTVIQGAFS